MVIPFLHPTIDSWTPPDISIYSNSLCFNPLFIREINRMVTTALLRRDLQSHHGSLRSAVAANGCAALKSAGSEVEYILRGSSQGPGIVSSSSSWWWWWWWLLSLLLLLSSSWYVLYNTYIYIYYYYYYYYHHLYIHSKRDAAGPMIFTLKDTASIKAQRWSHSSRTPFVIPNCNSGYSANTKHLLNEWPFQDPKLEVPTIYKAYVSLLFRPM